MPPLTSLQLRRLLSYCFPAKPHHHHRFLCQNPSFSSHLALTHFTKNFLSPLKPYSTTTTTDHQICHSLSEQLLKNPNTDDPLSVSKTLHLHFSHITLTPSLVLSTLNLSPDAGRTVLGFHRWLLQNPTFTFTDETLSFFVDYLGRRKDFKATHDLITENKGIAGFRCFESLVDRLVRAGRPSQVVGLFERMDGDYGFKRDKESLKCVVEKLCTNGFASYAEKMVKNMANEIFPDEGICDLLIKGWCVDEKLEEARRLAGEMYRGGFEIGTTAYNAILDCVCKLCRKKDPFLLHEEAEKVLVDMEYHGVPRNTETFNVLISNLCKIRRTEDAMNLFHRMGEWGCQPNAETFIVLIRSLYLAARVGEGDEMIDRMKSAGFGDKLDKKAYYGFLKVLCGIERLEHAMSVFKKMKKDGCKPGMKTYDLLMGKWCACNRVEKANVLFNEAVGNGVPLEPKEYRVY
ncbi:PPR domain-containing protein/PPR_2 domain-containing protein/PPR_3 domain-containing protein [Cephalotus follicularis]|uniref:PPR domain-containing protein/PPR_2 domain-containing protein/PPR_3 domain-containing protein n=1 Tax=Cephalotus follicularis TaxID=3775 RepID=A0A1Q3D0L6_CEPFO|nr:PPR domain-containing protein/PPR_2 domain-containing protein/PPR_3 domain-containing protein [Cephalotus follicularis]